MRRLPLNSLLLRRQKCDIDAQLLTHYQTQIPCMKRLPFLLYAALVIIAPVANSAPDSLRIDMNAASAENPKYWITESSGKTHNSSCRYYKKSKGHGSDTPSGNDCKVCGGASRGQ